MLLLLDSCLSASNHVFFDQRSGPTTAPTTGTASNKPGYQAAHHHHQRTHPYRANQQSAGQQLYEEIELRLRSYSISPPKRATGGRGRNVTLVRGRASNVIQTGANGCRDDRFQQRSLRLDFSVASRATVVAENGSLRAAAEQPGSAGSSTTSSDMSSAMEIEEVRSATSVGRDGGDSAPASAAGPDDKVDGQLDNSSWILLEAEPELQQVTSRLPARDAPQTPFRWPAVKQPKTKRCSFSRRKQRYALTRLWQRLVHFNVIDTTLQHQHQLYFQHLSYQQQTDGYSAHRRPATTMISYSRAEGLQYAIALKPELQRLGLSVYLDVDEIPVGCDWQDSLNAAIFQCEALVCLVTESYGLTRWTSRELKLADALGKRIIPVNFCHSGGVWPPAALAIQLASVQFIHWQAAAITEAALDTSGGAVRGSTPAKRAKWRRECVSRVANQIKQSLEVHRRQVDAPDTGEEGEKVNSLAVSSVDSGLLLSASTNSTTDNDNSSSTLTTTIVATADNNNKVNLPRRASKVLSKIRGAFKRRRKHKETE